MELILLGSSSSGNATLVRANGSAILIDAGLAVPEIRDRLGREGVGLEEIAGVLVTHEHSDHTRGLSKLTRRGRVRAAANEATALALTRSFGAVGVHALSNGTVLDYCGFRIRPIPVPHDSADCAGFVVDTEGRRLVYATDLGSVPPDLIAAGRDADIVMLESNHDLAMLWAGLYPQFLKERITGGRGHLSNELAGKAVAAMASGRLKRVVLAHLSVENNRPDAAVAAVKGELRKSAGLAGFDVAVEAAPKDGPRRVAVA